TCSNTASNQSHVHYTCAAGSDCSIQCGSGGPDCNVACATGASCSVDASANNANPSGTAHCSRGLGPDESACNYTFGSQGASSLGITCDDGGACNVSLANSGT